MYNSSIKQSTNGDHTVVADLQKENGLLHEQLKTVKSDRDKFERKLSGE